MVGPRHLARHGHLPPTDQPHSGHVLVGVRHGHVMTNAVRSPVRSVRLETLEIQATSPDTSEAVPTRGI